ncbi:MAG: hypothetical protein U9Q92_06260, partial [archaeon]|nr:hypothetical protein [archaeon]
MNKTKLGVLFVVSLLAISGIAMAQGASAPDTGARYYVKSNNGILKAVFGVQHNFEKGFTTDLAPGQQKALEKLGVETEKVGIYHILGKPICGDAICQGNEPRTCPQDCVATCGNDIIEAGEECEIGYPCLEEGYECIDCKCIKESTRLCTPQKQIPWGIAKVNGGSGGAGVKVAVLDTGVY